MIFVDPRFGSEREGQRSSHRIVAETLPSLGVEVDLTMLDCGDFSFFGNGPESVISVGVELKVVSDFVNSMRSGRLAEQIEKMSVKYQRTYLIVEGFYRSRPGSGLLEVPRGKRWRPLMAGPRPVFWAEIEKFITGLEEVGVRVRRSRTSNETARVIAQVLCSYWDKEYDEHRSFQTLYQPAMPMQLVREDEATQRVRRVCIALKAGIGYGRSKAVAERFRSVVGLVNAGADEWEQIEGIGKTIARGVYESIREVIPDKSPKTSAGRVPARRRVAARSVRRARQRPHAQLDAGRRHQ